MRRDKRPNKAQESGRRRAIGRYHDACTLILNLNVFNFLKTKPPHPHPLPHKKNGGEGIPGELQNSFFI